ncbi:MAG: DUF721 domain-containing protein [Xanthomonadales bacterium]|nr:DUF721 domain-containing protein [Xanthomonadales bacterium]
MAESDPLKALKDHGRATQAIKAALWPHLPHTARQHCDLANFRDSTLFLVTDSPVWAARLRHMSRQILHAARQRCKIPATRIKVRISPILDREVARRQPRELPEGVRRHFSQVAETVDDPELAAVFRRMSEKP